MTAIVPFNSTTADAPPVTPEIISPGEARGVRVIGRAHPLNGARVDFIEPAGSTIDELIEAALRDQPTMRSVAEYLVHVDGEPVPRFSNGVRWWSRVRPKPGATVTFTPVPGNLRAVLSLAIAAAAIFVAPYLAPGLVTAFATAGITVSAATAGSFISAGIVRSGAIEPDGLWPGRGTGSLTPAALERC